MSSGSFCTSCGFNKYDRSLTKTEKCAYMLIPRLNRWDGGGGGGEAYSAQAQGTCAQLHDGLVV